MTLITNTDALAAFCRDLAGSEFITVDTEFLREKTYWPKLCLVQVAGPGGAAAIDPLADRIDLSPLYDLFLDARTLKVFHAARQDLEIFFKLMGRLPAPLFDTQLAAAVCGFGDQVSYETLINKLARVRLDKGSRFTDWSLRPLSQRQVDYALSDVIHLRPAYEKLRQRLLATGRAEWLAEDLASLLDPAVYTVEPREAWRRIKNRTGNRRFLAVLRELAAWREREAQARDLPRPWVMRDEALLEIAHHTPRTAEELGRTRGLARKFAEGAAGGDVLAAVNLALAIPLEECPPVEERRDPPRGLAAVVELLKVLLKMTCEDADVAQRLVASSEDIELIAALGDRADVPALHGWRRQVYGAQALKVRDGHLGMVIRGRKIVLLPLGDDPSAKTDGRPAEE